MFILVTFSAFIYREGQWIESEIGTRGSEKDMQERSQRLDLNPVRPRAWTMGHLYKGEFFP